MSQRYQTPERSKKLSELRRDLLQIEKQVEALRQSVSVLEAQPIT
jgi:hypothetical protein